MKKAIGILLIICTLTFCLVSCGGSFSNEDQEKAIACAEKAAKQYYFEDWDGKSIGAGKYTDCRTSIKDKTFTNGKYVITVTLEICAEGAMAEFSGVDYWHPMDIKYTIKVTDGSAKIINTEYITD